jgi:hypothetical protein
MIPVETNPRILKVIEVTPEKTAVVKQMHQKSEYPVKRTLALIGCFILGIITAAIVLHTFF